MYFDFFISVFKPYFFMICLLIILLLNFIEKKVCLYIFCSFICIKTYNCCSRERETWESRAAMTVPGHSAAIFRDISRYFADLQPTVSLP